MRRRGTGLLLAFILLVAAIPAVLDCCLHAHGPDSDGRTAYAASVIRVIDRNAEESAPAASTRGCVEHASPTQTPYIEPTSGGGANPYTRARVTDVAADSAGVLLAAAPYLARRTGPADDGTGPPLWLSTCVSRT
ncbi:MAG TPA: hypothetical protein VL551_15220 [Actinospica sp.]|jgi:hypothetical protein|nr:hypothetical protein [Actinospica sp.]